MNSAKLNDWLQVIGLFGVIASLVFVGMQLKLTQEIALSSAYQARASSSTDAIVAAASDPIYTAAYAKIYDGEIEYLTTQERVSIELHFNAGMLQFENNHYQYLSGFLSEEHWAKNLEELRCNFTLQLNRELIKGYTYRQSFQNVIQRIKTEVETNPSDCWEGYISES